MATQHLGDSHVINIGYSGHTGKLRVDGFWSDGVVRNGNTVTLKNFRCGYNHYATDMTLNFGWATTWWQFYMVWKDGADYTNAGAAIGKTGTFKISDYGWFTSNPTIYRGGDMSFGDVSFTVSGSGAGSQRLHVGAGINTQNNNTISNRDGSDPHPSFVVNYPANDFWLNINVNQVDSAGNRTEKTDGSIGKFDQYRGSTKIGSQISDQASDGSRYAPDATYTVNNITEQSADWYYTGSSSYSGTMGSADRTIQLDFKATSVPTGLDAVLVSRAWNQIVAKATCTGFGAPNNRSGRYIEVGVALSSKTAYSDRYVFANTQNATATGNKTFSYSSTASNPNSPNICGCAAFKLGAYANNKKKTASVLESTVYYLPPAPMASVTLNSTTRNEKNVTFKVRATGKAADGVNNIAGAKVNLQYRYSTDGGTTYSAWTNAATNYTPNTAQDFNITAKYNTAVKVQVRQATYQDTTQVTAALTLDIAAVHPIPKDPTLTFSWDNLDRIFTSVATNTGTGGDTGDSSLKRFEYQVSWNSDFSSPFVSTTPTTSPYTYTIPYLKPLRTLYVRVRTVNNWDLTSNWVSVHPTVPRPLWGLVKGTSTASGNVETIEIRDMVKVKTDDTVSPRDWIEGTNNGKKRIVNT